ncbi:MAG TPA: tetratricopeptide repeat protein [Williamwhitmania sp.]|nr:tetratricopeptide repeat protein [Williamwhitmania sp.]
MTKVGRIILGLLLMVEMLPAQNAREDSLLSLIPEAHDKARVDIYLELATLTLSNNPEKSLGYAESALEISSELNLPLLKARALESCAASDFYLSHYTQSLDYLKSASLLYKNEHNSAGLASCLNRMGASLERLGNYAEALAAYQKSLTIEQEVGDRLSVAKALNNLGLVYRNLGDYTHALSLFEKARELSIQMNDSVGIVYTQNNVGLILLDLGRYDDALPCFLHVLEMKKRQGNRRSMITTLENLGITHFKIGNLEKAAAFYFQAAQMANELTERYSEAECYNDLAEVLSKQGKYSEAIKYATKSYNIAKGSALKRVQAEALLTLSNLKHLDGNESQSRSLLMRYINIKDSIFSKDLSDKVAEFRVKYDYDSQSQTNDLLNQELNLTQQKTEKSAVLNITLLIFVLVVLLFAFALVVANKKIRSKSNEIDSMNKELNQFNQDLEHLVQARTKELNSALIKSEESDRLKTAFLTNMSHEIRTPLNGIIGFSKMLEEELPFDIRKQYIEIIDERGRQLLEIINDIISIAKIESGQLTMRKSACSLNQVVNQLVVECQNLWASKLSEKIDLKVSKGLTDEEVLIVTDSTRLQEIAGYLLENAFKFTEEGTIELGYKPQNDNKELLFWVKDSGPGILKEKQKLIFERFNQVGVRQGIEPNGTGLGLAISKGLVSLLGGEIWVESDGINGSTFYFTIPYTKINSKNDLDTIADAISEDHPLAGKTILVVEADLISFQYLETILGEVKASIVHVKNGEDALEICQMNTKIDLVLMEMQLPFMDGYETTKKIKLFRKNLPIIAQTASVMPEDKIRCFEAGCDDFIGKPIDPDELMSIVTKKTL